MFHTNNRMHHHHPTVASLACQHCFRKAIHLYKLTLDLMLQQEQHPSGSQTYSRIPNGASSLVVIAVIQNQARSYHALQAYHHYRNCLEELRAWLPIIKYEYFGRNHRHCDNPSADHETPQHDSLLRLGEVEHDLLDSFFCNAYSSVSHAGKA